MKKILAIILLTLCTNISAQTYIYYVDPVNGSDAYPGTITQPFRTISKAVSTLSANIGTIYLRAGTHLSSAKINLTKNGQPNNYIKIWAYPGEKPVVDFTGNTSDGFSISGTYYHFKGLEVKSAGHNGIFIGGNSSSPGGMYNIIENCITRDNGNTGLHMRYGASYNLILNCDSYRNFDSPGGGNADGFSAKWEIGPGNKFAGCRAWNNSDDGWDLWMGVSTVEIDSCWAFRNGFLVAGALLGNGNGFKLGGNSIATPNTVKNCIAFDNAGNTGGRGFDENNNLAGQTLYNCTSYRNKKANYWFNNNPLTIGTHTITNCISYLPGEANSILNAVQETNSWQGFTVSNSDFLNIDTSGVTAPRDSTGRLVQSNFFRLAQSSDLVNVGTNVGIAYNGSAPDLGAYESQWGIPMVLNLTVLIEGLFNGTTMVGDTLTVELRVTTAPFTKIESQKMFVTNGGSGTANFANPLESELYYIVVKHRNSIETWSSIGKSFTSNQLNFDFTTASSQAYGNNLKLKGTKWCIYSGDVNQDGIVDSADMASIENNAFNYSAGYTSSDLSGDTFTDLNDIAICDNNKFNLVTKVIP